VSVPILLITFNRPDHVGRVLSAIRKQKPKDLFVFQDGAREGCPEDQENCQKVRDVISQLTDWDCNLYTYFSPKNLGCGAGPMTGIDWFFNQVNEGIVMEDDCLPHPDFFGYCEDLLRRYRAEENVFFINATLYDDKWKCKESYGFSHYMVTGAWAGWKRTVSGFDLDLNNLNAQFLRRRVFSLTKNRAEATWWYSIVKEIQKDRTKKSYWDYQMQIHLFMNKGITIHPRVNLISNIGFDENGTHTLNSNDNRGNLPSYPILPMSHPPVIYVDTERDSRCWAKVRSQGLAKDLLHYWYQRLLWSNGLGHQLLMAYKKKKGTSINTRKV